MPRRGGKGRGGRGVISHLLSSLKEAAAGEEEGGTLYIGL